MYDKMIELIKEYIACARYSCSLLNDLYNGPETFIYASKVLNAFPKEGFIGDVHYKFHGRGCLFEYTEDRIDIDFGPDGRCDGFDFFRLYDFMKHRSIRFQELSKEESLRELFEQFVQEKILIKHPLEPDGHLYFLSERLTS